MDYDELAKRIRAQARPGLVEIGEYGAVHENGRDHALLVAVVPGGVRQLVITTGFHGEEPSGPLTMGEHLLDVARWMREANVGGRIYPCINPSGFEGHHRYNASGEKPN